HYLRKRPSLLPEYFWLDACQLDAEVGQRAVLWLDEVLGLSDDCLRSGMNLDHTYRDDFLSHSFRRDTIFPAGHLAINNKCFVSSYHCPTTTPKIDGIKT